jgi:Sugar kinases, ribokinase family
MKHRILVVSSANVDFVQRISGMPERGATVTELENSYAYVPGGKGANAALTFAKLGSNCVFCTKVGNDSNGNRLKQLYAAEDIDVRFIATDRREPTGLASILVEDDGANRIIVYPGANKKLAPSDVESAFTSYPDALFLQFEIPDKAILAASGFASAQGIPVFVDAAPARADFPLSSLGPIEIFSLNESETEIFTGINPSTAENCLRAVIRFSTMVKAKYIVLKLGARGSYLYDGSYYKAIPAYKVDAVDTTAAGDIYTAALTYEYLQSGDIDGAINFATAAAAIAVTRAGASTSVPDKAEILKFIEENGTVAK